MLANIWNAVFVGFENKPWQEIPLHRIDPYDFMAMLIFLFICFKPSRGGGELRSIEISHFDESNPNFILIDNPSKHNDVDTKDGAKKIFPSVNGKGFYEAWQIYKSLRPIFPDNHKHKNVAFLKPAKRVSYDTEIQKYTGFARLPIGKNGFDSYFQHCGKLTGIIITGTVYSVRYSMTSTLIKSGVNRNEVKKNWTKHKSGTALDRYYKSSLANEEEKEQQEKFEKFVNHAQDDHNSNFKLIDDRKSVKVESLQQESSGSGYNKQDFMKSMVSEAIKSNPTHLHFHFS